MIYIPISGTDGLIDDTVCGRPASRVYTGQAYMLVSYDAAQHICHVLKNKKN
jgi:hypothetical protein